MKNNKQKILIIVGPTASGKSALAVRLAKKFRGEVISADSRQVYKGLDAGTGKVTRAEMRGVTHHMLDVADPKKIFSVSDYRDQATASLRYIISCEKLPIVCGGTGFYIDTLLGRIDLPEVPPNELLRKKLDKLDKEELFEMLRKKDPRRAEEIDYRNKVRIIRALEIIQKLGKVPRRQPATSTPYDFIFLGLNSDQEKLNKRIHTRILKRLDSMIREARGLHRRGLSWRRMEALGLEYRYLARLLQKKISKQQFVDELYAEIKKYSKRQMTWFNRNKQIKWFEPNQYREIEKYLTKQL